MGGVIPALQASPNPISPRKKGVRLGAKVLFVSIVLFPLLVGASIVVDSPGPLILSFVLFLAGALRMLYARLFEDGFPAVADAPPQTFGSPVPAGRLPAYQSPAFHFSAAPTTGDLVEPPSVTEHTTRFLDEREPE